MANRNEITPSESVVRISIPYLTNFIVSLPFFGMVASFITSVLFTKEQIFESECGSRNFIPSFSSVIGVSPGKYIWRMAIAFHCFPRFLIASLYHNQFKTCLSKLKYNSQLKYFILKQLISLNTFFELCEVFGLILLSYISSKENYSLHEKAFIIFMLSSTFRMITCLILFRHLLYKLWLNNEIDEKNKKFRFQTSYQWKMRLFCSAFIFSLLLIIAYIRHTSKCSNNVGQPSTAWSYFSACEYIICCLIMGYHATVCWDFNHFELTIYNKTTAKLNYEFMKSEEEIENEQKNISLSR
ncbi:unnamed protein product [Rotaria sp. Silwood1]|nr:unnamed protein product [Rotaria sp. Silwood1]CAF3574659.1 unnamed protein product [Rotaria sp. Silwood1]CAF3600549.1 unnamed protein product [Rotaria sp. Silwood1]CAF3634758.1 unnamed protein product [Rotaria sp. Silwood1]CAF4552040.1 unnamed protein product [Rotaria sp. Silwood1]